MHVFSEFCCEFELTELKPIRLSVAVRVGLAQGFGPSGRSKRLAEHVPGATAAAIGVANTRPGLAVPFLH